MASYYYLIASLPMLKVGVEPPLTYSEFLEQCKSAVSASTYKVLESLSVESSDSQLLKKWAKFYEELTTELNYRRNQNLGRAASAPDSTDAAIAETVKNAVGADNPLKGEELLLQLQFSRLDDMIALHNFDDTALYGYAMKLKLLERQTAFEQEAGKTAFDGLLKQLQKEIFSIN